MQTEISRGTLEAFCFTCVSDRGSEALHDARRNMHPSTALLHRLGSAEGAPARVAVLSSRCVTVVEAHGAAPKTLLLRLRGRPTAAMELCPGMLLVSDSAGGLYTVDLRGKRVRRHLS